MSSSEGGDSPDFSGFGEDEFGTSEFGSVTGEDDFDGWGEGGFGEGGFGGGPVGTWDGLFGTGTFGTSPFGGVLVQLGEPPQPPEYGPEARELLDTVAPKGPDTVRDRFEHHIKSAFNSDPDTQWDHLLNTLSEEMETVHDARDDVMASGYVDHATGRQLDKIGYFVGLPRRYEETDPHYRARLKVQMRAQISGGTIRDIKETAAILLETVPSEVGISEPHDVEPARMNINIRDQHLEEALVSIDEFVDFLNGIRAGGVRIVGELEGSFEHRSIEDYDTGVNDIEKSYDYGTYAGLFTT